VAITVVNQSVSALSYTVFGGSTSGSGTGGSGSKGSGTTGSGTHGSGGGSGVVASGVVGPGGTASGIQVGAGSYTVVFGWKTFPSYTVSASGVVKVTTTVQP
jgi:hypothetical protein